MPCSLNCHLAYPQRVTISEWQEGNRSFWSTAGMPHHTAVIETLPPDDDEELTFGVFEQNTKPKTTHRNKCEWRFPPQPRPARLTRDAAGRPRRVLGEGGAGHLSAADARPGQAAVAAGQPARQISAVLLTRPVACPSIH